MKPSAPEPFDDSPHGHWKPELWDANLPKQKGFVRDFVLALRGMAVPTSFCTWVALAVLSALIKREAWIEFYPKGLFSNFYLLLVSPPSICKKDTAIDLGEEVLKGALGKIRNPNILVMKKQLKIIKNEATKQGINAKLAVKNNKEEVGYLYRLDGKGNPTEPLLNSKGKPVVYKATSEALILAPEFGTMVGKEQYKEGLISYLLELYNTKEGREYMTRMYGEENLGPLHTVLIAGTTPDAIRETLPKQIAGDGFLSRCVVVLEARATRYRPYAFRPPNAPTVEQLAERLAWIVENAQGEYKLSEDAKRVYEDFYSTLFTELERYPELVGIKGRMDNTLMKLSLLMRAQRYNTGKEIQKSDVEDALRVLHATFRKAEEVLDAVAKGREWRHYRTVARYLAEYGPVARKKLLQNTSRSIDARELNVCLQEMVERGHVEIRLNGVKHEYPTRTATEVYKWIGKEADIPS